MSAIGRAWRQLRTIPACAGRMWSLHATSRAGSRTCARSLSSSAPDSSSGGGLDAWDGARLPLQQAGTLPSCYYTSPAALALELPRVFHHSWQVLSHVSQLAEPGDYFTVDLPGAPVLACRDQQGRLRAFHNVCRHHAAAVAAGSGRATQFRCPYHGWTYDLSGRLQKAVALRGIEGFRAAEQGLVPLETATLGPWLFGRVGSGRQDQAPAPALRSWLGAEGAAALEASGACRERMLHVARREYTLRCNWKVFCDNYLDGGYHVAVAHPELAGGLDLGTYASHIYERVSIQTCRPRGSDERLAGEHDAPAAYAFIYPAFMINSYGPWVDTNQVIPTGPDTCKVIFNYYVEPSLAGDAAFLAASLAASDQVQQEDIALCESVQRGLASPAYDVGRYVPRFEAPMFAFHRQLYGDLQQRPRQE